MGGKEDKKSTEALAGSSISHSSAIPCLSLKVTRHVGGFEQYGIDLYASGRTIEETVQVMEYLIGEAERLSQKKGVE